MADSEPVPSQTGGEQPRTEAPPSVTERLVRIESIKAANISDQAADEDSLGFEPYVMAIAEFLTNPETKPPLTLSIEGEWGSGKSSFMKQLEKALKAASQEKFIAAREEEKKDLEGKIKKLEEEREKRVEDLEWLSEIRRKPRNFFLEMCKDFLSILGFRWKWYLVLNKNRHSEKIDTWLTSLASQVQLVSLACRVSQLQRIEIEERINLLVFNLLVYPWYVLFYELRLWCLDFSKPNPPRIIWFNAWRHDKSQSLWAAFALEFLQQISKARTLQEIPSVQWGNIMLFLFRFDWEKGQAEAIRAGLVGLFIVIASISILSLSLWFGVANAEKFVQSLSSQEIKVENLQQTMQSIVRLIASGLGVAASGTGLIAIFHKLKKTIGDPKIDLVKYLKSPDYDSQVDFIEKFHEDFKKIVDAYAGKNNKVYVLIDDLDRCELPKAAELMQALNLMIANDPHLIFLLGMDREKVAASIAFKQKDVLPYLSTPSVTLNTTAQNTASSPKGLEYGYAFIEKFVQLSFQVPQPSETDFDNFLRKLSPTTVPKEAALEPGSGKQNNSPSTPARMPRDLIKARREAIRDRVETTKIDTTSDSDKVREIILMIAPILDWNPRRIKQFINLFRLRAYIASATGLFLAEDLTNNNFAALTLEQLGKFTALGLKYPLLLVDLEKDSKLLANLQRYALGLLNKPTTISYSISCRKTKYWGNETQLMQLLQYGCAKESIPKHLEGKIKEEDYPNYSVSRSREVHP